MPRRQSKFLFACARLTRETTNRNPKTDSTLRFRPLAVSASRLRCARALPPGLDRAREIGTAAELHRALQAALDALGRHRVHG